MTQKLPMETPVYLFLGFLESGKTKFIQETLEDPRFNSGEKTLLLVCEEGEEEYEFIRYHPQHPRHGEERTAERSKSVRFQG